MKSLESADRSQLILKQTKCGARDFELYSGDDLVGILYWPKWLSDRAVAECADGKWLIDRVGFFRHRVAVTDAGSGMQIASLDFGWLRDGDLTLTNGRVFRWYRTRAFRNFWALADENNQVLFEIQAGMHWFKYEADVVLHIHAESLPDLPLLILTGWYLGYVTIQDTAAAVAACTVVT